MQESRKIKQARRIDAVSRSAICSAFVRHVNYRHSLINPLGNNVLFPPTCWTLFHAAPVSRSNRARYGKRKERTLTVKREDCNARYITAMIV